MADGHESLYKDRVSNGTLVRRVVGFCSWQVWDEAKDYEVLKGERLRGDRCRWRWGHGERQGTEMAGRWGQVSNRVGSSRG